MMDLEKFPGGRGRRGRGQQHLDLRLGRITMLKCCRSATFRLQGSEVNDLTTEGGEAPTHAVPSTPITSGLFSTTSIFIERRINSSG